MSKKKEKSDAFPRLSTFPLVVLFCFFFSGVVPAQQCQMAEAVDHFERALQLEPDSAENNDNLGIALARMGRLKEAAEYFSKAPEIDSSVENASKHLKIAQAEIEK